MPAKSRHNKGLSAAAGQSLIEAMIAISIILFGILAVSTLLSRSTGLVRVVTDRYVGTNLAAEGIEVIKNIIDSNYIQQRQWNQGLDAGVYEISYDDTQPQTFQDRFISFDPATKLYQYSSGRPTTFKRMITIEWPTAGEEIKVNAKVTWISHGGDYEVELEDHFYNWRS